MSMSYKHTLIPGRADYAPYAGQVRDFVRALDELGATPINSVLQLMSDAERISWLDGKPIVTPVALSEVRRGATKLMRGRQGRNPLTGEMLIVPSRYCTLLSSLEDLPPALDGLDQYEVEVSGVGPPKLSLLNVGPANVLCESPSEFRWRCCLSRVIVSTSDYHGHEPTSPESPPFGEPVDKTSEIGYFSNPETLETIKVPGAGCARFWIELAFGKWLFPKIGEPLDLLHPSLVTTASKIFGINFAQGCWWG